MPKISHDDLIGLIYESVHDKTMIIPVMQEICKQIGAMTGHFMEMDVTNGTTKTSLITDTTYLAGYNEYITHYYSVDPRLGFLSSGAAGEWRSDQSLYDKRLADRNEFYSDYLRKYDLRYIVGSYIGGRPEHMDTIGFLRPLGAANYSEEEFAYLRRLSPHLTRASMLRAKLDGMNLHHQQDQTALSYLPYGLAWVDAALKVTSMNDIAHALLTLNDGITIVNNRLIAYAPHEHDTLIRALRMATSPVRKSGSWQTIRRKNCKLPLLVSVIPAPAYGDKFDSQTPSALLLFQDPQHRTLLNAPQIREIFGLTAAEARLAEGLLKDETLQSYADKSGISRNTARTHLVNLFDKTGTRRQAELIRVLLSVAPR